MMGKNVEKPDKDRISGTETKPKPYIPETASTCEVDRGKWVNALFLSEKDRNLVVIDRNKLAMKIQDMCWIYHDENPSLEVCYGAISACEDKALCETLNREWEVALWELRQRTHIETWDTGYHGKVKSGEHASG